MTVMREYIIIKVKDMGVCQFGAENKVWGETRPGKV